MACLQPRGPGLAMFAMRASHVSIMHVYITMCFLHGIMLP
jgi:hypothetical protein